MKNMAIRTCLEDRMLTEKTKGCRGYAERVCFRLIPHFW